MDRTAGLRATLPDDVWIHLLDAVERDLIDESRLAEPLTILEIAPRLGGLVTLFSDRHEAHALLPREVPLSPAVEAHVSKNGVLPFADESIDLIFLLDALATDPAPAHTLAECARVLREGGEIVLAVVNPAAVAGALPHYPELMTDAALPGLLSAHDLLLEALHTWGPRKGQALAWLGRAVRARHSRAADHNRLGVTLFQQGKIGAAKRRFDRAVELDPELLDARMNRATIIRMAGHEAKYRAELEEILRRNPEHAGARAALADQSEPPLAAATTGPDNAPPPASSTLKHCTAAAGEAR